MLLQSLSLPLPLSLRYTIFFPYSVLKRFGGYNLKHLLLILLNILNIQECLKNPVLSPPLSLFLCKIVPVIFVHFLYLTVIAEFIFGKTSAVLCIVVTVCFVVMR